MILLFQMISMKITIINQQHHLAVYFIKTKKAQTKICAFLFIKKSFYFLAAGFLAAGFFAVVVAFLAAGFFFSAKALGS